MWSQPSHGARSTPSSASEPLETDLAVSFFTLVVLTNVLRGLALVAKEQSTNDGHVEGHNSSGKEAKHCMMTNALKGLAVVAKEQNIDDERVEGPSSSGQGAKR